MKLGCIIIVLMQSCAERQDIVGHGSSKWIDRYIETMYEINVFLRRKPFEKRILQAGDGIPSGVGHFVFLPLGKKTFHVGVKDAEAVHIPFLGMPAHQLHAQADSQYRLFQIPDEAVQPVFLLVLDGCSGFSHTGEDNFIVT